MLWTDADFITTQDLMAIDAEVSGVAAAEEIPLESPTGTGMIHQAIEGCGDTLMKYLQVFGGYLTNGTVSANHTAAVMNLGIPSINRSKILLGQVVTSSLHPLAWTPLKRWGVYWALYVFYNNAANRREQDRYRAKAENYRHDANSRYWDAVRSTGVPIVRSPLPCPGAVWEPGTGIWADSALSQVAGAGTVTDNFNVVVTWVDQTPGRYTSAQYPGNAESAPSRALNIDLVPGNVLNIDITALVPPSGKQHPGTLPFAVVDYMKATGWNVYAGVTPGPLYLQTPSPLPVATKTWTANADPLVGTPQAGNGQYADLFMSLPSGGILQRG